MDVVVFYDSCFRKKFGSKSTTRIRAIMAIAEEMYSERDTLQTTVEFSDKVGNSLSSSHFLTRSSRADSSYARV